MLRFIASILILITGAASGADLTINGRTYSDDDLARLDLMTVRESDPDEPRRKASFTGPELKDLVADCQESGSLIIKTANGVPTIISIRDVRERRAILAVTRNRDRLAHTDDGPFALIWPHQAAQPYMWSMLRVHEIQAINCR